MSTPDTFRDALASVSMEHSGTNDAGDWPYFQRDADAVLASDEMQAIRTFLRDAPWPDLYLPQSVLAWVLDDPSPDSPARCVCGEVVIQAGTVELAGVKHRTDGPCYHCDAYGNEITEWPDSPADKPCETCGGSRLIRVFELDGYNVTDACPSCRGGEPT